MAYNKKDESKTEKSFLKRIQDIERNDPRERKLSVDFYPLAEKLYSQPMDAVPIFNWLADVDWKKHHRGEKYYLQLVFPVQRISWRFIQWIEDNGVAKLLMNFFNVDGVFITRTGTSPWTYPASEKNNSPEAKQAVKNALWDFQSGNRVIKKSLQTADKLNNDLNYIDG